MCPRITKTKSEHHKFLKDTIEFYSEDVSRRAASDINGCMYRTEDGRTCAIGRHIPEDEYDEDIEGSRCDAAIEKLEPEALMGYSERILIRIQSLHDGDWAWEPRYEMTEAGHKVASLIRELIDINPAIPTEKEEI